MLITSIIHTFDCIMVVRVCAYTFLIESHKNMLCDNIGVGIIFRTSGKSVLTLSVSQFSHRTPLVSG